MEEEKNKAIMNCGDDYDDILDIQYGRKGTPSRDRFDREAEAFILAERLKEERRKAGLTQEQLAAKIGTKKSYISSCLQQGPHLGGEIRCCCSCGFGEVLA